MPNETDAAYSNPGTAKRRLVGPKWYIAEATGFTLSAVAMIAVLVQAAFFRGHGSWWWNSLGLLSLAITAFGAAVAVTIYLRQVEKSHSDFESQHVLLAAIKDTASDAAEKAAEAALSARSADDTAAAVHRFLTKAEEQRRLSSPGPDSENVTRPVVRAGTGRLPKHVLWVDDNVDYIEWERRALGVSGVATTWVPSTKRALELLKGNRFDLVISDMGRREGPREGYVLLDEMRRIRDETPFIIYSTSDSPDHWQETVDHGGQGCTGSPTVLYNLVMHELEESESSSVS